MASSAEDDVQLLKCKHYDVQSLKGDIADHLCTAVNKVTPWEARGAQKMRSAWITGILVILSNQVVYNSKARCNSTGRASHFMNGDRYIFASTGFDPPLPEKALIGDHMCRIWYASRRVVQCDRCNGGHSSFDKGRCPLYIVPLDNVSVFTRGLLSNFGKCTVNMGPLTFPSSEHAYQFRACEEHIRADLAELIYKAETPKEAKAIAAEIKSPDVNSKWNLMKCDVMREVLVAKMNSSDEFRKQLLKTGDSILVEASSTDAYWGSGLSYSLTTTTHPDFFPGENQLGKLLMELRDILQKQMKNSATDDVGLTGSEPTPGPSMSHSKMDTFTQPEVTSILIDSNVLDASPKHDAPLQTDDSTIPEATSIPDVDHIPNVTAKPDVPTKPVTLHKANDQSDPEGIGQSEKEVCSAGKEDDQLLKSDKVRKTKKATKSRSSSPARSDLTKQVQTKLIRDYFKQQELKRKRQFSPEKLRALPTQDTASVSSVASSGNVMDMRMQDFTEDEVT